MPTLTKKFRDVIGRDPEDEELSQLSDSASRQDILNLVGGAGTIGGEPVDIGDKPEDVVDDEEDQATAGTGDLPSVSTPQGPTEEDRESIRENVEEQFDIERQQTAQEYEEDIQELRKQGKREQRSLGGELGTARRFSSSAQAFMQYMENQNQKKINELKKQKQNAIDSLDMKQLQEVQSRIDEVREQAQQDFDNTMTILRESRLRQQQARVKKEDTLDRTKTLVKGGAFSDATSEEIENYASENNLQPSIVKALVNANQAGNATKTAITGEGNQKLTRVYEQTAEGNWQLKEQTSEPWRQSFVEEINDKVEDWMSDETAEGIVRSIAQKRGIPEDQIGGLARQMATEKAEGGEGDVGDKYMLGDVEIDPTTQNIIEGAQSLDDLTTSQRTQSISELRRAGFYNSEVPSWYLEQINSQSGQTFTKADIQGVWNEMRQEIINEEETEEELSTESIANIFVKQNFETKAFRRRPAELRIAKEDAIEQVKGYPVGTTIEINGEDKKLTQELKDKIISDIQSIPETREEAERINQLQIEE